MPTTSSKQRSRAQVGLLGLLLILAGSPLAAQGPILGLRSPRELPAQSSATRSGFGKPILIGAAVGAGVGAGVGAWFGHAICDAADCSDETVRGLIYGAVGGAVLGAGVGAGIHALFSKQTASPANQRDRARPGLFAHPVVSLAPARRTRLPSVAFGFILQR